MQADIGILGFSKAFDKVPHTRLIQKLGIRGKPLQWIKQFLSNRLQRVVIEGCYLSSCEVTSGVPQGSVLGPNLFLIFINDLINNIQSTIRLFADDCLIYRPLCSSIDHKVLQQDLDTLIPAGLKHGSCNLMLINVLSSSYPNTITKVHFHTQCQASSLRPSNNTPI